MHCSATQPLKKIRASTIDRWHRKRGWLKIGYHYVIRADGSLEFGRQLDEVGAHAKGHNKNSIGICLVGGVNAQGEAEDNFSRTQKKTLKTLLEMLISKCEDGVTVCGHRDLPNVHKACPCFDVKEWLEKEEICLK